MIGAPWSCSRIMSELSLRWPLLTALALVWSAPLSAQSPQLSLPEFMGGELVYTESRAQRLLHLLTFKGSKEWSGAKITWRYPLHPEDEQLWGTNVSIEDSARVVQERIAALKTFDLSALDPVTRELISPMVRAAEELEVKGAGSPISTEAIQSLYPRGLPPRVTRPLSAQLSSYSTLVPNTWVLWLLTPRAQLKELEYARYARIFSTLKENARPQDRAILIEGEEGIETSSFVPSIEEWTPEQWTSGFRPSVDQAEARVAGGVARVDMLRSVMRNLIHELSSGQQLDTRCGQPCSHVIPNMNILIFADQIEAAEVRSLQALVHSRTNVFYGAHMIQVKMSRGAPDEEVHAALSELRLPSSPASLPHTVTQSSLSEVFKQINDWRDQRFVVQPLEELAPYYWSEAGWELSAEVYAQRLGLSGRVSVELPKLEGELSRPMSQHLKRFQSDLKALRFAERGAQLQLRVERALLGVGLLLVFVLWLTLVWRKRSKEKAQRAQRAAHEARAWAAQGRANGPKMSEAKTPLAPKGQEGNAEVDSAEVDSPEVDSPEVDNAEVDSPELPGEPAWAERSPASPQAPRAERKERDRRGEADAAGPYIPTTSDHADAEESSAHEPSAEPLADDRRREEGSEEPLDAGLEGSSNPWYDRPESAPPSEHVARLAQDDYIHYESDPPTSSARLEQPELNTAPYGASIVIRADEAALFAIQGPLKGKVFRVNRSPALVGRGRGVDCKLPPLDDLAISRCHCTIIQKSIEAWEIICASPAGLYVNDVLIREGETQTLYDKDLLTLGRSRFSFRLGPIGVEDYPRGVL